MLADDPLEIHGLKEFRKELKHLDSALPREIGKANQEVADFVLKRSQTKAQAMGGVQAHAARRGMKARRSQRTASITLDGQREPTILGAEFGAKRWRQFPRWRGNQWNPDSGGVGYFLHPEIRDSREKQVEIMGDAFDRVARKAFPRG